MDRFLTVVLLTFECEIVRYSPVDAQARDVWNTVVEELKSQFGKNPIGVAPRYPRVAQGADEKHRLAVIIPNLRKRDLSPSLCIGKPNDGDDFTRLQRISENIRDIDRIVSKLSPFLECKPQLINSCLDGGWRQCGEPWSDEDGFREALDLILVRTKIDPNRNIDLDLKGKGMIRASKVCAYPLECIPLSFFHVFVRGTARGYKPYWRDSCGDFGVCNTGTTLDSWLEPEYDDNGSQWWHQVVVVEWSGTEGARRFKDPQQRCTGIEEVHPNRCPNDVWDSHLMEPLSKLAQREVLEVLGH